MNILNSRKKRKWIHLFFSHFHDILATYDIHWALLKEVFMNWSERERKSSLGSKFFPPDHKAQIGKAKPFLTVYSSKSVSIQLKKVQKLDYSLTIKIELEENVIYHLPPPPPNPMVETETAHIAKLWCQFLKHFFLPHVNLSVYV